MGHKDDIRFIELHYEWFRGLAEESLLSFLKCVRIDCAPSPDYFGNVWEPWQREICGELVPAFEWIAGMRESYEGPRKFWRTEPRGADKTSLNGRICAGVLAFGKKRLRGVVAAATRDQANIMAQSMKEDALRNEWYRDRLEFARHKVTGPGGELHIISAEAYGSYGGQWDFIFCDELTVWEKKAEDEESALWSALYSGVPKKQNCVLVVTCNAGWKDTWQDWLLNGKPSMNGEAARPGFVKDDSWWIRNPVGEEGIAGWINRKEIEEQKRMLPRAVFERLWLNVWAAERGEFLTWEEIVECRDAELVKQKYGDKRKRYVASIDYGEKKDRTVCTVSHMEGQDVVVDRMDVWVPKPQKPIEVSVVEQWMTQVNQAFHNPLFVIDPWQLAGTIQKLSPPCRVERWNASGGKQQELAKQLRNMVLNRRVRWYAGCGAVGEEDLEREMAELVVKETERGWRFDHTSAKHDDRAVSLGMGVSTLLELEGMGRPIDPDTWDVTTERGKMIEKRIQSRMERLEKLYLTPSEN